MKRIGIGAALLPAVHAQERPQPVQRLQGSIERTTRSVNATWGIFVKVGKRSAAAQS